MMIRDPILITHVTAAVLSISMFVVRGLGMLRNAAWLRLRIVRIVPHVNDTVLLLSAIWLALLTHQYPFQQGWLTAKVIALVLYIGLGMVAMRWGATKRIRLIAWLGAVATFAYIVAVALNRTPFPWQ